MYYCTLSSTLLKTVILYRKTLNKWSQTWKMTFNTSKCEFLRLTKSYSKSNLNAVPCAVLYSQ